jgi:hypothetical protein
MSPGERAFSKYRATAARQRISPPVRRKLSNFIHRPTPVLKAAGNVRAEELAIPVPRRGPIVEVDTSLRPWDWL